MGFAAVTRIFFRGLDGLAALGVAANAAMFGLGLLGRDHWEAELLSHFRVQYVLALSVAGAYFLARRRWPLLLPTLILLVVVAWPLGDYLLPSSGGAAGDDKRRLRVMSLNVEASNSRADLVIAAIEQADPDVLFLPEATAAWAAALAPLHARYRYGTSDGTLGAFSLLLLSRLPVRDAQVIRLADDGWPTIIAHICPAADAADEDCIGFVGLHPPPPMSANLAAMRNDVFRALPDVISGMPARSIIVAGDFNCTPWSPVFADLLAATGLRDSALGFSVWPTWHSSLLPLGIKIDHVLVANGVIVRDHRVGGDVGSDHFPVIADLAY